MLHPQSRALLDMLVERGVPTIDSLPVDEARRTYRDRRGILQPKPCDVAEVRDLTAPGPHGPIPLRLYRPHGADSTPPVLVYFHGGGWTIGDLDTHDTLCRELADRSGVVVVAVDYRMGPEHRFPAAFDDALAATHWVREHANDLGVDDERVAVGGDSAGGNLAAAVAIADRDATNGKPALVYQLLIYPATDQRRQQASHTTNGTGYLLTRDTIRWFHDHYIDDPKHDLDWRASPLLCGEFRGLPPALVLTAGFDPLRDEGMEYAQAMSGAGVVVSYVCFERQIHGFITMGGVLDEAKTAVALCAAELGRVLRSRHASMRPESDTVSVSR